MMRIFLEYLNKILITFSCITICFLLYKGKTWVNIKYIQVSLLVLYHIRIYSYLISFIEINDEQLLNIVIEIIITTEGNVSKEIICLLRM